MLSWRRPLAVPIPTHAGCGKHPLEPASASCSSCHRGCCDRCAVPVRRRVLCIDCGMVLGGVSVRRPAY